MKRTKFLIIGARGLVGQAINQTIGSLCPWIGTTTNPQDPKFEYLDVLKPDSIQKVFKEYQPEIVIHAANLAGGAKLAQKNPQAAKEFYFDATVNLGKECLKYQSRFIFLSTECVFDGSKKEYTEEDQIKPVNVYGQYKAESEVWIRKNLKNYMIVRTMSVFGWQPETKTPNALMSLYFAVSSGQKISVPSYRWGSPTYVKDLAKALVELSLSSEKGIYHVVGQSFLSRYDWLKKSCEYFGWDASLIIAQEKQLNTDVNYPAKVQLLTEKFQRRFKTRFHTLDGALVLLKQDIGKQK